MNVVIIDDEKPAINILKAYAKKIPFLQIKLATNNPFEVLEYLSKEKADLLLTDIEMPDLSGVELVRSLEEKPMVIFTTAYEDYALDGYELDAIDYLVKPIRFERFLKAMNKANKWFHLNSKFRDPEKSACIQIKVEYKTIKVLLADILYIEGLKDYVKIYTTKTMYLTRLNLKGIENKLPADTFLRIHRSYIIALPKIESYQKHKLFIADKPLPIGNSYKEAFLKRLT